MARTIVQLTESQAEMLRKRTRDQRVSISELVRQGVDKILATPTEDPDIRRRAAAAVGFIHDVPDLAENHDKYLREAYGE
jgi:Arc/MetJ-type ribon-helix-helix transcriptional regulator